MKAKNMSNLYWFCQAVEHGGFSAASTYNHASAPTLSRAVSQLEDELGEKLVHRHAKQFILTSAGNEYYQKFAPIFQQLDHEWQVRSNTQPTLTGDICVSCPEPFAEYFLQQLAIEFMATNPDVNIHIKFASDTARFFDDQIDLAVSTSPVTVPNLVQRRLFITKLALAAAPEYIAQHGRPGTIDDLRSHHLLAGNTVPFWEFQQPEGIVRIPLRPKYSINSLRLVMQAACAGAGICLIPHNALSPLVKHGQLEEILPGIQCSPGEGYLVWADRNLMSTRVAVFRDLMLERINGSREFLTSIAETVATSETPS